MSTQCTGMVALHLVGMCREWVTSHSFLVDGCVTVKDGSIVLAIEQVEAGSSQSTRAAAERAQSLPGGRWCLAPAHRRW